MVRIATAGNTINPALLVLKAKGYEVRCKTDEEGQIVTYWARRDGNVFIGEDPVSVLGLVTLWEHRGEDWKTRDNEPFLFEELEELEDHWLQ
jgi:hypothetical protein